MKEKKKAASLSEIEKQAQWVGLLAQKKKTKQFGD